MERTAVLKLAILLPFVLAQCQSFFKGSGTSPIAEIPQETVPQILNDAFTLAQPLSEQSQNGITVSIFDVYADAERITIEYNVTGLSIAEEFFFPCPVSYAALTLDGKTLPPFQLNEVSRNPKTRCQLGSQSTYQVMHTFYPDKPLVGNLELELVIELGGMTLYREDGAALDVAHKGDFNFNFSREADGKLTLYPMQYVMHNGVGVTFTDLELNYSSVDATLCLDFDNRNEWLPSVTAVMDNANLQLYGYNQIAADVTVTDYYNTHRCFLFVFNKQPSLDIPSSFRLVIERLQFDAFARPTQEDCANALASIQSRYAEVGFVCYIDAAEDGFSFGFEITSLPAGLSDGELYELFRSELQGEVDGPWEFLVDFSQ